MCRRKRSRPSSRWRLTKKVKRLSAGELGCDSAIGDVDAARLITNICAGVADSPVPMRSALLALIAVKLRGIASVGGPAVLCEGHLRCKTGCFASPPRDGYALVTSKSQCRHAATARQELGKRDMS